MRTIIRTACTIVVMSCFVAFSLTGELRAEEKPLSKVKFGSIQALEGLIPQKTDFYAIKDDVEIEGNSYRFHVTCPHADYQVDSISKLAKLLHEIRAIEEYRKTDHGNQVWEGFKSSGKNIGRGAKQIVLKPRESARAIVRGVGRLGRSVTRFIKTPFTKKKVASSGEDRAKAAGGFLYSGQARMLAYQLRVDVYTDNPYLRGLLEEVAKARWKGSIGVSAALFVFVPVPGLGAVTDGALTPSAREEATELLIRDNSPPELELALKKQYRDRFELMEDRDEETIKEFDTFIKNPNYSPREKAYIFLYMTYMKDLEGRHEAVRFLGGVNRVETAMATYDQFQLLSALHRFGSPLKSYVPLRECTAVRTRKGTIVALMPYDRMDETRDNSALMAEVAEANKNHKGKGLRLGLIGEATPKFKAVCDRYGITVFKNILKDPIYRKK